MAEFQFKAADPSGKIVKGVMEAASERAVVAHLRDRRMVPIRIAPVETRAMGLLSARLDLGRLLRRVTGRDVTQFTQELATLLSAGLPVDRALGILAGATPKESFKRLLLEIKADVQSGSYLSDALAKHPRVFSNFLVNMVKAGESGGVLEAVLERVGDFLESTQEMLDHIKSSLIYPFFLVLIGGVSILILLTVVIPKFSIIFEDMGAALPLSTRLLLAGSGFLERYFWLIAAVFVAGVAVADRYRRTPAGRLAIDRRLLRIPVLGALIREIETARFARTLGTLVRSGVPILRALNLAKDIVQNRTMAGALDTVHTRVKEGEHLSAPMADTGLFPDLAAQMIRVGEETGRLGDMLIRVGDRYEKSVRVLIKRLISLLEPVMILAMGLVVGFVVISMLTAIFSINEMPF